MIHGSGWGSAEVNPNPELSTVTQEWWGVTEIVKEQAAKLAAKGGFRCLIPDLYKGKIGAQTREKAPKQPNTSVHPAVGSVHVS